MKKSSVKRESEPPASRPYMPGYGIPKTKKGLLPWSHVATRMAEARHYWICTVDPASHPHATPVDGLWLGDRLYFGGYPTTRRNRNLARTPRSASTSTAAPTFSSFTARPASYTRPMPR